MRLVVDTNILVSALLFRGVASQLHARWVAGQLRLIMSPETEAELVRVLAYPTFRLAPETVAALLASEILPFRDMVPAPAGGAVSRDPEDDRFLWLARAAGAAALVTGDADLLVLAPAWEGVRILRLAEVLAELG